MADELHRATPIRLGFFYDATYPSVLSQTTRDFDWLVLFDDRCSEEFRAEVEELADGVFTPVWTHADFRRDSFAGPVAAASEALSAGFLSSLGMLEVSVMLVQRRSGARAHRNGFPFEKLKRAEARLALWGRWPRNQMRMGITTAVKPRSWSRPDEPPARSADDGCCAQHTIIHHSSPR